MRELIEFDELVSLFEEHMQQSLDSRYDGYCGMLVVDCAENALSAVRKAALRAGKNIGWKPRTAYSRDDFLFIVWDDRKLPENIARKRAIDIANSVWNAESR
ncbi:hypothetical protein NONI108955_21280 [Nocardia ninae]|uniref:Uncharacterized protein n=1 Tax=Nocardia ninae NBRC 108245 TaxID=1210091 RepID=A0A511MBK8_9NOCA|nr:hypothetical protein [Nocardia ninae]GEM37488.1 hypothetical protein NN4_20070 [Nocardia ninae NBRC 108245]